MNKTESKKALFVESNDSHEKKRAAAGRVLKITSLTVDDTRGTRHKEGIKFMSEKVKHSDIVSYILWLSNRKKGEHSFNHFLTKRDSTKNSKTIISLY